MTPMEMHGISMAPWLTPGDMLLVDTDVEPLDLRIGDVAVMRVGTAEPHIVHRIVGRNRHSAHFPFRLKGDRNLECDLVTNDWTFVGKVKERYRGGQWTRVKFGKVLTMLSLFLSVSWPTAATVDKPDES